MEFLSSDSVLDIGHLLKEGSEGVGRSKNKRAEIEGVIKVSGSSFTGGVRPGSTGVRWECWLWHNRLPLTFSDIIMAFGNDTRKHTEVDKSKHLRSVFSRHFIPLVFLTP